LEEFVAQLAGRQQPAAPRVARAPLPDEGVDAVSCVIKLKVIWKSITDNMKKIIIKITRMIIDFYVIFVV
jgi:hypothetical protein